MHSVLVAVVLNGTLGNDFTLDIPVTSVTQEAGQQLAATPGLVLRVDISTFRGIATTYNVLAETPGGNPNNVVMVGAHLACGQAAGNDGACGARARTRDSARTAGGDPPARGDADAGGVRCAPGGSPARDRNQAGFDVVTLGTADPDTRVSESLADVPVHVALDRVLRGTNRVLVHRAGQGDIARLWLLGPVAPVPEAATPAPPGNVQDNLPHDPDARRRSEALLALTAQGPSADTLGPLIATLLEDEHPLVRARARPTPRHGDAVPR